MSSPSVILGQFLADVPAMVHAGSPLRGWFACGFIVSSSDSLSEGMGGAGVHGGVTGGSEGMGGGRGVGGGDETMGVRGELASDGSMRDRVDRLDGGSVRPRRRVVFGESSTFAKK